TVQFKLDVINYMTITKSSAQEVANHFGINNSTLIAAWKQKFLNGGVNALSKMKGRPPLNKNKNNKEKKLTREQELEHENQLLKAELAFLKKLRASGMNVPERLKTNAKQK
ncbi:helix-turn-helix domain-containing protein, partial [Clostridioides difficile]